MGLPSYVEKEKQDKACKAAVNKKIVSVDVHRHVVYQNPIVSIDIVLGDGSKLRIRGTGHLGYLQVDIENGPFGEGI